MRTRLAGALLIAAFTTPGVGVAVAQQETEEADGGADAALFESLESGDLTARRRAVYALWQRGEWDEGGALALSHALADDDAYVRTTGARALVKRPFFTPEILEQLGDVLREGHADVRLDAAKLLWRAGPSAEKPIAALVAGLGDENADVRANAAAALEWTGERGAPAVPTLRERVRDDDVAAVRTWAARALGSIDADALVAVLAERAGPGGDAALRVEAIGQLGYAGRAGASIAARLGSYLTDDDAAVRLASAQALGAIGPAPAVDAVVAALDDADEGVRGAALAALNFPGPQMQVALPRLIELLDSTDAATRSGAAVAIGSIDADCAEARLAALLTDDPDPGVRQMAAFGMSGMGERMSDASAAAVVHAVTDADATVSQVAVQTLYRLGGRGAPARDAVLRMAEDAEHPFARQSALLVLARIAVSAETALPVLVAALDPAEPMIARAAARTLAEYGEAAAPAAARLATIVRSAVDASVRGQAAMTLWKIGPAAAAATKGLDAATADAPFLVRVHALTAVAITRPAAAPRCVGELAAAIDGDPFLGAVPIINLGLIGTAAAPAVPRLIEELDDEARWWNAALALARIGGESGEPAVDLLLAACRSDDARRRNVAFLALGELPRVAKRSVPALVAALDVAGTEPFALAALGALGPAAAEAVPAVEKFTAHETPAIRHAARSALVALRGR